MTQRNRKQPRPYATIETIEQLESRDLPSANPLSLDFPHDHAHDWQQPECAPPQSDSHSQTCDTDFWGGAPDDGPCSMRHSEHHHQHDSGQQTSQRWDKLLVGSWYVPEENLLAYVVISNGEDPVRLADETVFDITSAHDGAFSGTATIQFSIPIGDNSAGDSLVYDMSGVVTRDGTIRITFTPTEEGQPTVTGLGNMEYVDGSWRMTMQMSSGVAPYVIHWAYMSKLATGETPPPPVLPTSDDPLPSDRYSWLEGTDWTIRDSEFFGDGGSSGVGQPHVFHITSYDNGYFFGTGGGDSTPFTVVGSITPEGRIYLVLTSADGTATRTGELEQGFGGEGFMHFRSYEGTAAFGIARELGHHHHYS